MILQAEKDGQIEPEKSQELWQEILDRAEEPKASEQDPPMVS